MTSETIIRDNGVHPVYPLVLKREYLRRRNALKAFYRSAEAGGPRPRRVELSEEVEGGKTVGFILRVFSPF
jgi:hypothetical protein